MGEEQEYTVVAPDGKEITLIGPKGASQEEVIKQAQALYQPKSYNTAAESARAVARGLTFDFADEIEAAARTAPQMFSKQMQQGGFASGLPVGDKTQVPLSQQMMTGLAEGVTQPTMESDYTKIRDEIRAKNKAFQKDYPVLSTGLEIAGGLVVPGLGASGTIGKNIIKGAGMGAAYGAGQAENIQDVPAQAFKSGLTGAGLTGAFHGLGRAFSPKVSQEVQKMQEKGIQMTPGQIFQPLKSAEESIQKLPFVGSLFQGGREKSLQDFNHVVLDEVLSPIGKKVNRNLTKFDAIESVQKTLSKEYETIIPKLKFDITKASGDLDDVVNKYVSGNKAGLIGKGQQKQLNEFIQGIKLGLSQNKSPQQLKTVLSDWKSGYKNLKESSVSTERNLGNAMEDAYNTFYKNVMKQNPQEAVKLKNLDNAYARLTTVEKAATRTDGLITPSALHSKIVGGKTSAVDRKMAARGDKTMQKLSLTAKKVLGDVTPDSGTATRLSALGLLSGGAAALNLPKIAAGILGGGALYSPKGLQILNKWIAPKTGLISDIGDVVARKSYGGASLLNIANEDIPTIDIIGGQYPR